MDDALTLTITTEPLRTVPLTTAEKDELTMLIDSLGVTEVTQLRELVKVRDALMLSELGVRYTTVATLKARLGV